MAPNPYEEVRGEFIQERPTYEKLVEKAVDLLQGGLKQVGVHCEVTGRAKDVQSFTKKVLRNPKYQTGTPVQDKAGVRVVLPYLSDEPAVQELITEYFHIDDCEEKIDDLGDDKLGYLAVHYIVRIKDEHLDGEEQVLFADRQAEIQVGSMAQRAWAEVSHELLYKSALEVPTELKRMINRLMALVELFDGEVGRVRSEIAALPGYEFTPLTEALDRELLKLSGNIPDRGMSGMLVPRLGPLYGDDPEYVFSEHLQPWIESNHEALQDLFGRYREDPVANPLLYQPEAFLVFERSENDPTGLAGAWPTELLPRDLLVSLTELWGHPLG